MESDDGPPTTVRSGSVVDHQCPLEATVELHSDVETGLGPGNVVVSVAEER